MAIPCRRVKEATRHHGGVESLPPLDRIGRGGQLKARHRVHGAGENSNQIPSVLGDRFAYPLFLVLRTPLAAYSELSIASFG